MHDTFDKGVVSIETVTRVFTIKPGLPASISSRCTAGYHGIAVAMQKSFGSYMILTNRHANLSENF